MSEKKYIKSPLNYTGGKYRLLPQILPLFPSNINTFVDLFTGGANVAVNVDARKIVANDSNSKVIEIYNRFQELDTDEILNRLDEIVSEWGMTKDNKESYLKLREHYNQTQEEPLELFILICHAFNYQLGFNNSGGFNTPFGARYFNNCIRRNLVNFKNRLDKVTFTNKDFRELKAEKLRENDFVYCDPPYSITDASYMKHGGWNDVCDKDLLELLDTLNDNGVKFGLSNVLSSKGRVNERLIKWCKKYDVHHLSYNYMNSSYQSKDKSADSTDEVLITNF